jgi:hypothetical protein
MNRFALISLVVGDKTASEGRLDSHEDVDDDPFFSIPARVRQDQ